jgi:outer membrane protein assembly factor BamB
VEKKSIRSGFLSLILMSMLMVTLFLELPSHAVVSEDDWPMFHHDLARTGYSTSPAVTTPVVLWTSPKEYGGSPVVANGYIYLLDLDHLYCFSVSDGHQVWNQSLPSGLPNSCPAVCGGYVYTPLTAYNASTGELVLNYTDYQGYSSPTVAEGIIYFGSVFGKSLFALNATTGSKIWNYTTEGKVTSSPAIADGRVYFESWDGNIYALDALTGTKIWDYSLNAPSYNMDSSPTIVDGRVYVGAHENIYCLDALTGNKMWNYSISGVRSSPAVANGYVYVGDDKTYAFNASSGAQVWNATEGSSFAPAVADGLVYVSDSVRIVGFNVSTGNEVWNYTFSPTVNYADSSPAIVDGVVYAAGGDAIYAFGASTISPSPLPSQEPFPTTLIIATVVIVAVAGIGLLVYFKKRK